MRIALVGNQNSGKTTLFNLLTGSNQKVGNWPGVTIERKVGTIKNTDFELVDLPGIYSLSPYTTEEEVSRRFIFENDVDLIINIVDSTSIERSMYLTTQLLELDCDVIVVLNMQDILATKGITLDTNKLSELINASIVSISAKKNKGIDELISLISNKEYLKNKHQHIFSDEIENRIKQIQEKITIRHPRFTSVKMLEEDKILFATLDENTQVDIKAENAKYSESIDSVIADQRYKFIEEVKEKSVTIVEMPETISSKLDKIFLHKYLSLPIFIIIIFLVYFLSVGVVGSATVDAIENLFSHISNGLANTLSKAGASDAIVSLVCDGIVGGIGAVLNFIPQLIILFLCISLLETTGYMSRIAFMFDKIFRYFGLSGKALIPFIVGSGCSVPGIMTTRTIENNEERQLAVVLTPFIPCSAKLPIISLFAGAFFPKSYGLVSASIYFLAIAIILCSAILLKKFVFKKRSTSFLSELPEYKAPSAKYVFRDVFEKTVEFFKRAGSIILLSSIIIWFLSSFNYRLQYGVNINESILANIGNMLAWLFYPMLGEWSWAASVCAIQGLAAKEGVVSAMEVIAGVAGDGNLFSSSIFSFFTSASAYAFMAFNLFSAPCFGAIAAMKRELGSTKKMLLAILFQTVLAFLLSYLIFGIGSLIGTIV